MCPKIYLTDVTVVQFKKKKPKSVFYKNLFNGILYKA